MHCLSFSSPPAALQSKWPPMIFDPKDFWLLFNLLLTKGVFLIQSEKCQTAFYFWAHFTHKSLYLPALQTVLKCFAGQDVLIICMRVQNAMKSVWGVKAAICCMFWNVDTLNLLYFLLLCLGWQRCFAAPRKRFSKITPQEQTNIKPTAMRRRSRLLRTGRPPQLIETLGFTRVKQSITVTPVIHVTWAQETVKEKARRDIIHQPWLEVLWGKTKKEFLRVATLHLL